MFKTTFALLAATAACAVPLSPGKYDTLAALQKRLVINPEITSPQKDTVWTVGSECTVKWSTDLLQEYPETQNYTGTILLGYTEDGDESEHLDQDAPLADGFPLSEGQVNFTLPKDTEPRDGNAIIVLLGDSGNASPPFTIKAASDE